MPSCGKLVCVQGMGVKKISQNFFTFQLNVVPNSAIMDCSFNKSSIEKWFLDFAEDKSAVTNKRPEDN